MILRSTPELIGEPRIQDRAKVLRDLDEEIRRARTSVVLRDEQGRFFNDNNREQRKALESVHKGAVRLLREAGHTSKESLAYIYHGGPNVNPVTNFSVWHRDRYRRYIWTSGRPKLEVVSGSIEVQDASNMNEAVEEAIRNGQLKKSFFPANHVGFLGEEDIHRRERLTQPGARHIISFQETFTYEDLDRLGVRREFFV